MNILIIVMLVAGVAAGASSTCEDNNRILRGTIDSLVQQNLASQPQSGDATARIEDAKQAAETAAVAAKANKATVMLAKDELARQLRTAIWWIVCVFITLLTIAAFFVYKDHNRVQSAQVRESTRMFSEIMEAIRAAHVGSLVEAQKATDDRTQIAEDLKANHRMNEHQIEVGNHINDKVLVGKAEVERKIDNIEALATASVTMLEEMKDKP